MNPNRRPHILLITKWYPNCHDVQIGVFIRKQILAILDHADVTVFYAQSDDTIARGQIETEVLTSTGLTEYKVYFPKNTTVFSRPINAFRYFNAWLQTWKEIRRQKGIPDVVHAYILLRPGLIAWWMNRRYGIPYIVSEQWSGYVTGKFEALPVWIRALYRYIARNAVAVTAVSDFLQKNMLRCGFKNPIQIIPNIIEVQEPPVTDIKRSVKTQILIVADLVDEIKNISGVLRAIAAVVQSDTDFELRIIGHGRDEIMLKNLARELGLLDNVVFFEGIKANEFVYQYLWACDFLVMNSRFETFSLVCAEALSCGKPVICTRCGGPEEFINPENGILITPDSESELISALQNMMQNYQRFDSKKIRAYALSLFSKEQAGEKFYRIYREVLQDS